MNGQRDHSLSDLTCIDHNWYWERCEDTGMYLVYVNVKILKKVIQKGIISQQVHC